MHHKPFGGRDPPGSAERAYSAVGPGNWKEERKGRTDKKGKKKKSKGGEWPYNFNHADPKSLTQNWVCSSVGCTDLGCAARHRLDTWRAESADRSSTRGVGPGPDAATGTAATGRIWLPGAMTSFDWQLTWGWCVWDDREWTTTCPVYMQYARITISNNSVTVTNYFSRQSTLLVTNEK